MHDVFYRKEISMTDMTKAKVYAASLGTVFSEGVCSSLSAPGLSGFDSSEYVIFPGFCDVHVHFREPGFSYKETIATGSRAAARGGYTAVCTMPNLNPVPDSVENLRVQRRLIEETACIHIYPYGAITVGEQGEALSDLEGMAPDVVGFSDDGRGVQSDDMMRQAMLRAKALGKPIVAHCEVNSLLRGGYIHDGDYAKAHGHRGICSESEWVQIARDLALVKETGCAYHVCHVSAKESVALIRKAKAEGLDVTCETGPHYLVMDDSFLQEDGRFKMNPPLRGKEDREALLQGILDGTIDMIATDHAPHSAEEKARPLTRAPSGMVGLETSLAVTLTALYHTGKMELTEIVRRMTVNPASILGLSKGRLALGNDADIVIFDPNEEWTVDPEQFASKGRNTPFAGWKVKGRVKYTIVGGTVIYEAP